MDTARKTILVVDDEKLNITVLKAILDEDYNVIPAKSGEQAFNRIANNPPDLILLDLVMPDMDGFEVCKRLKQNSATFDIPVIFVTAQGEEENERKGLELGAIDYITKPFRPEIVKTRVQNQLKLRDSMLKLQAAMVELERLHSMALDANPLSGLPGNNSVMKQIKHALKHNEDVCVIYSDLDNFKAYNDKYGFALGDEVLLFTSDLFKEVITLPGAFIGHIGGDDFVVVVSRAQTQEIADRIIQKFDQGIIKFYSQEDVAAKCIQSVNRRGESQTFPLISISLAGVDLTKKIFSQYVEVNDACAGVKKRAKTISGSCFIMDRRTN